MSNSKVNLPGKLIPLKTLKVSADPEWLRTFKGCEHYNDQEAREVISSIDLLADILIENAAHKLQLIDNQIVIDLINTQNKAA